MKKGDEIDGLVKCIDDGDENVRRAAIRVIGEKGRAAGPAVARLITALKDEEWRVRSCAHWALKRVEPESLPENVFQKTDQIDEDSPVSRQTAGLLRELLDRYIAIKRGARLDRDAEALVAKAFGYRDIDVRNLALAVLTAATDKLPSVVLRALKSPDVLSRMTAAKALRKIGNAEVLTELIAAVDDDDWFVRSYVIEAIAELGAQAENAVPKLIDVLQSSDIARSLAAWALGKIGDPAALGPLNAAKNDRNAAVREAAENAARRISDGS